MEHICPDFTLYSAPDSTEVLFWGLPAPFKKIRMKTPLPCSEAAFQGAETLVRWCGGCKPVAQQHGHFQ